MKALDWYQSLAERERKTVLFGGVVAAVLLLAGGLSYLEAATSAAEARLASKRADLAWMQAAAPRLQSMPKSLGKEPLPLVIDSTARQAGLASALSGSEPAGSGALRVRLQNASFDALVVWLARLQQERGLVVESASIDGTEDVGRVNANLVFREP